MEDNFNKYADKMFEDLHKRFKLTLNILVIGKVSSGKSSFLNAFFDAEKDNPIFEVGAEAGKTTKVQFKNISKNIKIGDTPGLDDITETNSKATLEMLNDGIDIGILIISGVADTTQKKHFDDLKTKCKKVFVVLNRRDEFSQSNLDKVINQWKEQLDMNSIDRIYPVRSQGYDTLDRLIDPLSGEETEIPVDKYRRPRTLFGIEEIRDDVLIYLKESGKDILLAKELKNKTKQSITIITAACVAAGGFAFIPGSALYIGLSQATAIASLSYLYTGKIISKSQAAATMGITIAQATGTSLFLLAKSFIPPTGILDITAAIIAIGITAALLTSVSKLLERGYSLEDKEHLTLIFNEVQKTAKELFKNAKLSDIKNESFLKNIINQLLK